MTESEIIMQKWNEFSRVWTLMWRAFGRETPKKTFKEDVWEQCQYIPFEAWDYILAQVRDMDAPPRNWAKKLKALHFQWKETQCGPADAAMPQRSGEEGPVCLKLRELMRINPGMDPMARMREANRQAHNESRLSRKTTNCSGEMA
ncbi:hypothetical protein GO013_07365 [Pseudodesulfovibrio sp. JC047]|uniref:hypothetical protein n=1 Tax=Pseudodesulfovibrio sp. JC047 TaxID=2683199 RepID=UPI0013D8C6B1|nr:hypothetical protein [Pseudodesulfovibrio sp. JC047]NDV19237.1 hypothetical protein [Pseudodesulfovibrio sp. JC047]